MFSKGQLIFTALFVVTFIIIIVLSYKKDKKIHSKNYQGVKWVAILFVLFIVILFFIKNFVKN